MGARSIVTAALVACAVCGPQAAAHAARMPAATVTATDVATAAVAQGRVHLVASTNGTVLNDALNVTHSVTIRNLGPDTATGLYASNYALFCPSASAPLSSCVNTQPYIVAMSDLPPGGSFSNTYLLPIPLGNSNAVVVRATVEVIHVDQTDAASVPGTCNYGLNPQDDCTTAVTQLSQ